MRHINIPIFIPHLGCPNQCVFCNQRSISGVSEFQPESVKETIEASLRTVDISDDVEIAFFGGSFTGIDRNLMISLLQIAHSYIDAGKVLLLVFIVFSLIGMIDVFYESLRARREEFGLYLLAGMRHRELRIMKTFELTITILIGLVIGLVAFVLTAFAVNRGMSSRGMEVFLSIRLSIG